MSWNPFSWGGNEVMGAEGYSATPKPPSATDKIDGDINGDGASLLDAALQTDSGEVDTDGKVEGHSSLSEAEMKSMQEKLSKSNPEDLKPGVGEHIAMKESTGVETEDVAKADAFNNIANPNPPFAPGEWDEDEYGRSSEEAQADNTRLQETYGTTDPKKILRKNKRKGFFQNPVKSVIGGEEGREALGKGLQDMGKGLLGKSFNYDQFKGF